MDIMELGAIGELVGGVAVLVTLVYLALQVGQNTKTLRATSVQALHESTSAFLTSVALDEEATEILRTGSSGTKLSPVQRARYSLLFHAACRRWENALVQHRLGALDAAAWRPWENTIRSGFSSPGAREWWDQARVLYSEEFATLVDSFPPIGGANDAHWSAMFVDGTATNQS